jgi:hypothetical protein|tara:strand:+ start:138 stop:386 length:249 start_codon:yes stop_codon:yes gene_type:complete
MRKLAVDALSHKYKAEMSDAKYVFYNYLKNPVAIGEHPNLLEEMDTAVKKYAEAVDKLRTLTYLAGGIDGLGEEPTLFKSVD